MRPIRRAVEIAREEGLPAVVSRSLFHARHMVREAGQKRRMSRVIESIRGLADPIGIPELRRFIWSVGGGIIRPTQHEWEFESLLSLVFGGERPGAVAEIGTAAGGSLCAFCRLAAPDATVVSIDLPYGRFGGGYKSWRVPLYESFARPGQKLRLIRDDSHKASSLESLRAALEGRPLDFLFIDGDHELEGVAADFRAYAPLVRRGGFIGFHDVAVHAPATGCRVHELWATLKGRPDAVEFIHAQDQGWAGIGVVRA